MNPVFTLPKYRMGPYEMRTVAASRDMFTDKRRVVENDWTAGTVNIDENLSSRKALECFIRHLVTAIHYRSGLNDRSNEESYTHSLATGLVELARNQPAFWYQLQQVIEDEYTPGAGWALCALDQPQHLLVPAPVEVRYGSRVCAFTTLPRAVADRQHVYGYYNRKTGPIELSDGLSGVNLALVAMHEVLHFLHECEGLNDRTKEKPFKRAQSKLLVRFIRHNTDFWSWWLAAVNPYVNSLALAA